MKGDIPSFIGLMRRASCLAIGEDDTLEAVRDLFGLTGGQRLIVLTDDKEGIALVPAEVFEEKMKHMMEYASAKNPD